MSDYSVLDAQVQAQIVGDVVRRAIAEAILHLVVVDGTVSAATLRPYLVERGWSLDLLNKRMAAFLGFLSRYGYLRWTGRTALSGNHASRNDQKLVKVYAAASMTRLAAWSNQYGTETAA